MAFTWSRFSENALILARHLKKQGLGSSVASLDSLCYASIPNYKFNAMEIERMLQELERGGAVVEISKFTGDVVFTSQAIAALDKL